MLKQNEDGTFEHIDVGGGKQIKFPPAKREGEWKSVKEQAAEARARKEKKVEDEATVTDTVVAQSGDREENLAELDLSGEIQEQVTVAEPEPEAGTEETVEDLLPKNGVAERVKRARARSAAKAGGKVVQVTASRGRVKRASAEKVRSVKPAPSVLRSEPKWLQALFEEQFSTSLRDGLRRPKGSREDFVAGWYTLIKALRKDPRLLVNRSKMVPVETGE